MIPRLFILLSVFSSLIIDDINSQHPVAEKGILDLRQFADDHFILKLNGEWEFYWNRILGPVDFADKAAKADGYGKVPSYWTDYKNIKTSRFGYATYRLRILLPSDYRRNLGLDMPVFDSSYDLYLNSEYLGGNGIPGKSAAASKPGYRRNFFRLSPGTDTLSIVLNVSNFDHRRGGFWLPVEIGTTADIEKRILNRSASDWATISLLMGFSIFFLFFFIMFPGERIMAFFSMVTISLALRPFFTSHFLILNIFDMDWKWIVRCEYIGLYTGIIGGAWYSESLYPSKLFRSVAMVLTAFFSLCFLSVFLLPVKLFSYSVLLVYPSILIILSYVLYRSLYGALRKNFLDLVYFLGFSFLVTGALYDIRISMGHSPSSGEYTLSYIIILFIIIQSALLLYKWMRSYNEKDRLQKELGFINRNLEAIVNERTQKLKLQKEEIESQNSLIAIQNKQLTDTLQIRNKIFSVISHDLRTPVVNILYMLHMLKEKELRDKHESFVSSCIDYARRVIDLLENMLAWGREQEDRIKYSPGRLDLENIVLTNLSIFRETTSKKKISVVFNKSGNTTAFFDKDLLDIIIRNLLSNAIKYSHRGGQIEISLTGKNGKGNNLLLKIKDNGIGMPESKLKNLFNGGDISSTPGTENEKGTGLGLKLCYELIEINRGEITVESTAGKGTSISITLPSDNPVQ